MSEAHDHEHDHNHDHGHVHDEDCGCGELLSVGEIIVDTNFHNEAIVVSGKLNLFCPDSELLHRVLEAQMQTIAQEITEQGGIIGHIKAIFSATKTNMFSITDVELAVKPSPEQNVDVNLVAIVFAIDDLVPTTLVYDALHALKTAAI